MYSQVYSIITTEPSISHISITVINGIAYIMSNLHLHTREGSSEDEQGQGDSLYL